MDAGTSARFEPYCGPAPTPGSLTAAWNLDPLLLAVLVGATLAGALHLHRSRVGSVRQAALGAASGVAVLAFVSPLCALTAALFAARSLHHLVLIGVLAPALAVAFPLRVRGGMAALVVLSAALWAWHVPALYTAAWDSVAFYWLMQAALLVPAWAFWSATLAPGRGFGASMAAGMQAAALAGQMGLIGAILTFARRPLYPEHIALTEAFGIAPLVDQQLAGLIMWVPGMLPLALVAAVMLHGAWMCESRA